jgi:4-hydroxybenzoate polyprenyltransferase
MVFPSEPLEIDQAWWNADAQMTDLPAPLIQSYAGSRLPVNALSGSLDGRFHLEGNPKQRVRAKGALTFNRLADMAYDGRNPRTASRPLVTRRLSKGFAWCFLVLNVALFLLSAAMLNRLAFFLAFPVLALILGYSYTKRFTWGSHFLLGASLGCAPLGAWIAVRGSFDAPPLLLGLAVLSWTAGFDCIYACQDIDFDRREGLHSIPRRWGVARALLFARLLHIFMLLVLVAVGRILSLGSLYYVGVGVTGLLLAYEHSLVRVDDLSRVNRAFFTVNGCISMLLFLTTLADRLWSR